MSKVVSFSSRMKYCLSGHTDPNQTVDIHDIFIVKSKLRRLAFCLSVLPMISLCILLLSKVVTRSFAYFETTSCIGSFC